MGAFNIFIDYDENIYTLARLGPPGPAEPPGPGFKKTSDGNYDAEDKKLANLQKCVDEKDAASKKYVDNILKGVGNLASIGKYVGL